jgi:hypothetical protein
VNLPESILVKSQKKDLGPKQYREGGHLYRITAHVRYDDECGNKHNSFSITGTIDRSNGVGRWVDDAGGCIHEEVAKHFPELKPFIKWHLTSSDGPMYYIENTLYWLGWRGWSDGKPNSPPNLAHARNTAVWPDMPEDFIAPLLPGGITGGQHNGLFKQLEQPIIDALNERLPALMAEFKRDVESLGFIY